jgi:hypothetical protein
MLATERKDESGIPNPHKEGRSEVISFPEFLFCFSLAGA